MSDLKLTGKLIAKMNKQQVTDSFSKREFVMETDEQYPQAVKFELTQDKCEEIDNHKIGSSIAVHFNARGRKWTNKEGKDMYFVSLNAWRIEKLETANESIPPSQSNEPAANDTFSDSLPF